MQPCSHPWYGLIDWLNGMSGDALRAMMVRAGWIVTVVLSWELSGADSASDSGTSAGDSPAVVIRFPAIAPEAVRWVERRATTALRRRARRAAQRIGHRGKPVVVRWLAALHGDQFTRAAHGGTHRLRLESATARIADEQTEIPPLRHAFAACGRRARPGDRRARDADLPDGVVRLSRQRSRGCPLQHGARGPRLFAHFQPHGRRARGARRGTGGRRGRHRHRERTGGAVSRRSRRCWAPARTSLPRARSTVVRTTCSTTRCRASASKPRSSIRATSTPGARPSGRTRAFSSARRWAIPAWMCSTFRGWRSWRTSMDCRCSSTRRSPRPGSSVRSSMAPISCSIPRPSSCRDTASSSAACWSTPAGSIGMVARQAADFRH